MVREETKIFVKDEDLSWQEVGEGIRRKVMTYNDQLMLVKVAFNKDGIGALHHHRHTQISYVESGSFEVEIGGVKQILKGGDVFLAPSDVKHGVVCLEEGILVDVFNPYREDFVS